jgi:hypothetical protein
MAGQFAGEGLMETDPESRRAVASLPNDSVQDVDITITPP